MIKQSIVIHNPFGQIVEQKTITAKLCHISSTVAVPVNIQSLNISANTFVDQHISFGDKSWLFAK